MAQHTTDGKPKLGYDTYMQARRAANKQQKKTLALLEVYRCTECHKFHFGKTNRSYEYAMKIKQRKNTDERLVGRLIGMIRGTV